jgi:type IV pilus assembly protein PilC
MPLFGGRLGSAPPAEMRPERLDLIVFSRQMAIFLRAGIPILDGIRVVRQQAVSGLFRRTLDDVEGRLQEGMRLSAALARHPAVFFDLYVEMIRSAEESDEELDEMLDQLARYLETSQATVASRRRNRPRMVPVPESRMAPAPSTDDAARRPEPSLPDRLDAPATNGTMPAAPLTAQQAYDELVAKLRSGPVVEAAPLPAAPNRGGGWSWEQKQAAATSTPTDRKAAKIAARAASTATKEEAKRAKLAARAVKDQAKRERQIERGVAKAAEDVQKEAKKLAAAHEKAAKAAAKAARPSRFRRERRPEDLSVKRDTAGGGTWKERNLSSTQKVKRIELIIFSRQMATFIRAGIPIIDGIRVVREQTKNSLFRRTLDEVSALLESGEPLSGALAHHPRVFSELYIDMVVAAEATGDLDAILEQLAKYMERSEATARQTRQAMLYPTLVLGLACVVVFILMTVVLPSFVALFADFDAKLPLPTQILLSLGDFGGKYGFITGGIVVALFTFVYLLRNTTPLRRLRQRVILRLPVVGRIVKLGIETRFSRTLSILHKAGVPISQSFDIAAAGTGNYIYQARLRPVREALISGEGISGPLAASKLFGPLLVQMVKVGEETGTLDRYLDEAANFLDEELTYRTKQMVTIIEPLMILGVAGLVGFVALSVITPMYSILQSIK